MATAKPATKAKKPAKAPPTPTKVQREQRALRKIAIKDGLPKSEAMLTPFSEAFCRQYAHTTLLSESYRYAEIATRTPFDWTGYMVDEVKRKETVKGKEIEVIDRTIYDLHGRLIDEGEVRRARAAQLLLLPEIQAAIREFRRQSAELIKINAQSLADKTAEIYRHALSLGQLQVAANVVAMEAKLFGLETGGGDSGGRETPPPTVGVEIRIRDFSGKSTVTEE